MVRASGVFAVWALLSGVAPLRGGTAEAAECVLDVPEISLPCVAVEHQGTSLCLSVERLAVSIHPPSADAGPGRPPVRVHVRGALAFDGEVPYNSIPFVSRGTVAAVEGTLHLGEGFPLWNVHASGADLVADAYLTMYARIQRLAVPCGNVTVPAGAPRAGQSGRASPPPGAAGWIPATERLRVHARPGGPAVLDVEVKARGTFPLLRSKEAGGWVRVSRRWADGTSLAGWVSRDTLTWWSPGLTGLAVRTVDPVDVEPYPGCPPAERLQAERPVRARIARGTRVYARPGKGPWATVESDGPMAVDGPAGAEWVRIVGAPGLRSFQTSGLGGAWVPRAALLGAP